MENSKDKYYAELCNAITDYNEQNKTSLSNVKIGESTLKVMI